MKAMQKITNEKTGSEFYVIGHSKNGLMASIRFWTEQAPGKTTTALLFRIRVEPSPENHLDNPKSHIINTFPTMDWSSVNPGYCSVAGAMQLNKPIWNVDGILDLIVKSNTFGVLYERIQKALKAIALNLTKEEFIEFARDQITGVLTGDFSDNKSASNVITLEFGKHKSVYSESSDDATGTSTPVELTDNNQTSPDQGPVNANSMVELSPEDLGIDSALMASAQEAVITPSTPEQAKPVLEAATGDDLLAQSENLLNTKLKAQFKKSKTNPAEVKSDATVLPSDLGLDAES